MKTNKIPDINMRRPSTLKRDVVAYTAGQLRSFIIHWNQMYPIDRWWREKYKIPLNSEQHRKTRIVDMRLEWEEDRFYKQLSQSQTTSDYIPGRGMWLKKSTRQELSTEEIDDLYNKVSIAEIEVDNETGEIII